MNRDNGGAEVMSIVVLTPFVIAFVLLVFFLGRYVDAQAAVRSGAEAGAQAAALQRDPAAAHNIAMQVAGATLADDVICQGGPTITPNVDGFGPGGVVTVTVSCTIKNSDLAGVPGLGAHTLTAQSSAVIDTYRATP